jgi:hypothetical protein
MKPFDARAPILMSLFSAMNSNGPAGSGCRGQGPFAG